VADGGERDRARRLGRAPDEVVAAGVDRRAQGAGDHPQVGDLRLDLGQFGRGPRPQADIPAAGVPGPAGVEQFRHLVEGEAEPLRRLDHPQHGDRLGWVQPVATQGASGLGQQAAPFVVAQRLPIHPGGPGDLAAAQAGHAAADRSASASRTSTYAGGTRTSTSNRSAARVSVNVKNEQHALSRSVRSRAVCSAAGSSTHRSRVGASRC
jgi:hypothetical protein